ncbi:hypothetical protein BTZ20_0172 [Rhodococcus sp. MTM3W5.2]|nr:hypothetical protein BTZ20_0172 [Rhodococcus sp. MTM3W5.2]
MLLFVKIALGRRVSDMAGSESSLRSRTRGSAREKRPCDGFDKCG